MPLSDFLGNMFTGAQLQGQTMKSAGLPAARAVSPGVVVGAAPVMPAVGSANAVARPGNMPDYDFLFFAESAAADGLAAVNTIDGNPNTYTKMTHGFVLDKGRGTPFINTGLFTSLTVASGCAASLSMSYGGDMCFSGSPYLTDPGWAARIANGGVSIQAQPGENLMAFNDNGSTNEQGVGCFGITYGRAGHRWPQDVAELLQVSGLKVREFWHPRMPVTPSVTVMTGGASLTTTTDTKWIDGVSSYYILGATSHSILTGGGFVNVSGGLPDYMKVRNNIIPFGDNDHAAQHEGCKFCTAYWPIGPFSMSNPPIVSALGTVANAQVIELLIAKV